MRDRRHEDRRQRDDLLVAVVKLDESVRRFRAELSHRPTAREIGNRRRRAIAVAAALMIAAALMFDTHVEHCGPGARAEDAIAAVTDASAAAAGGTLERVQQLIDSTDPRPFCDLVTPLHGHNDEPYPTPWSVAGVMLYVICGAGLYLWARPRPPKEDEGV